MFSLGLLKDWTTVNTLTLTHSPPQSREIVPMTFMDTHTHLLSNCSSLYEPAAHCYDG